MTCDEQPSFLAFGDTLDEARESAHDELLASLSANPIDDPFFDHRIERELDQG